MAFNVHSFLKRKSPKHLKDKAKQKSLVYVTLELERVIKKRTISLNRESDIYYLFSVSPAPGTQLPSNIRKGKKNFPFPQKIQIKKGRFQIEGKAGTTVEGFLENDGSKFRNPNNLETFFVTTTNKKLRVS